MNRLFMNSYPFDQHIPSSSFRSSMESSSARCSKDTREFPVNDSNCNQTDMLLNLPACSLLGMMFMYDLEENHINPSVDTSGFNPIGGEYHDLSLEEILDIANDLLMMDQSEPSIAPVRPAPVGADVTNRRCFLPKSAEALPSLPPDYLEEMVKRSYSRNEENIDNFEATEELFADDEEMDRRSETIAPLDTFLIEFPEKSNGICSKRSHDAFLVDESASHGCDCDDNGSSSIDPSDRKFRPYQEGQWSERFAELGDYYKATGHCLVPHTYTENLSLARWVKRQRYQYKIMLEGRRSTMTQDRIKALEGIGFVWDSQGATWGDRLYELQLFQRQFHHCCIPSNYTENPRLATWIKFQRKQYKFYCENKRSNMTPQRIHELEKLGFEWKLRDYNHKKALKA